MPAGGGTPSADVLLVLGRDYFSKVSTRKNGSICSLGISFFVKWIFVCVELLLFVSQQVEESPRSNRLSLFLFVVVLFVGVFFVAHLFPGFPECLEFACMKIH